MAGFGQSLLYYGIAPNGFATSFPEQDIPIKFCNKFQNLFTNSLGNAEKRPGLSVFSKNIPSHITVTNIHELVNKQGETLLFASGNGEIWRYDTSNVKEWVKVFTFETKSEKIFSYYMAKKLIFYNGVDRNIFTEDGSEFNELRSLLEVGIATSGSNENTLVDESVLNWTVTNVSEKHLVYYPKTSAYGCIKTVTSAALTITPISAAAGGIGAGTVPVSGDDYVILDTLEVNIIPVSALGYVYDNKGTLDVGSTSSFLKIKKLENYNQTEIRKGDWVYNESRNEITAITSVGSQHLDVVAYTSAAENDVVYLLKSSMPICKYGTSHYQRAYMIDARDDQKIRISGINNPLDMGSAQAGTYDISSLQPKSEEFRSVFSFQRFLVVAGSNHIFFFEGTNPIAYGNLAADWSDLGMVPIGALSRTGVVNAGNEVHWMTVNGIQNSTLSKTTSQIVNTSTSFQIDKTLRDLLKKLPGDEMIAFHYPRRSWICFKAGSELYVYNYGFSAIQTATDINSLLTANQQVQKGTWHLFDGPFAQQKCYFIRQNGDLLTGDVNGQISIYDQGEFNDLGSPIKTVYETGWLSCEKAQKSVKRKQGKAIKPVFEAARSMSVTIKALAPYNLASSDQSIINSTTDADVIGTAKIGTVVTGGKHITFDKIPLRWHGENVKLEFITESTTGPFILSGYTLFFVPGAVE